MPKKKKSSAGAKDENLIGINEAVQLLGVSRPTFYRWLRAGRIKGMKVGRQWRFYRDDIDKFIKGQAPRIDLPADISPLIDELSARINERADTEIESVGESEVERAVRLIIALGVASRASDIHLASQMTSASTEPETLLRLRIDGVLHPAAKIDPRLLPPIIEQWKRMADCDVSLRKRPQEGRIVIGFPELTERKDKIIDIRCQFLPTGLGESVTARILDTEAVTLELSRILYAPLDMEKLRKALKQPWGLIVLTGPTGSGKTTVLYSCLNELTGPEIKTVSIEDPIEYYLPWVNQVAVDEASGLTFSQAVKASFRTDPDVIAIGEIRNFETLDGALNSSLTGHIVLTQMHADEAAGALNRMISIGCEPFKVAEATKLVLSQRLVRRLCPECSESREPSDKELRFMKEEAEKGGVDWDSLEKNFRQPSGCEKCGGTGWLRRNVIAEVLEVTPRIEKALKENGTVDEIRAIAVEEGMTTMTADGIRRVANGETSLDEVMRVLGIVPV
jgi:general secretion pathway protein E